MLIRTISGAAYVAILVLFFFLRTISPLFFNAFIWFLSFMGALEVARAVKKFSFKGGFILALVFGATFVPVYTVFEYFFGLGVLASIAYAFSFSAAILIYLAAKKLFKLNAVDGVFPILYPAVLLLTMLIINDLTGDKSFIALVLVFVISPCADVFAYLVGMTYNKIVKGKAKKLCPTLSPKKTVAGAIGGVIGGAVGGAIVCVIFGAKASALVQFMPAIIYFITVGLLGSVLTEVGDLYESGVKRKAGIKDMGKIMPGHGGVMDRIDGTLFCSALVCLAFIIL